MTSELRHLASGLTVVLAALLANAPTATASLHPGASSRQESGSPGLDYEIGPRDLLEIRVFGLQQLDTNVRVSEAGTISLPLVGELPAAGLTRAALESSVKEALRRYVNDPQVSIFIREYQSQRYSMIGAVRTPGTYEMKGRTTLLEGIAAAGGLDLQNSSGEVVVLRRDSDGPPLQVALADLLDGQNTALNIELRAGDTINVVPKEQFFVYIYGRVRNPGSFPLSEEITLLQAVSLAGGLADRAAANKISILRRRADGGQDRLRINLEDIIDGKTSDVPVLPNDVIIVPETFF